jgi:hypothetical protein
VKNVNEDAQNSDPKTSQPVDDVEHSPDETQSLSKPPKGPCTPKFSDISAADVDLENDLDSTAATQTEGDVKVCMFTFILASGFNTTE